MSYTSKQDLFRSAAVIWAEKFSKDLSKVDKHDLTTIADDAGLKFPHWITRVPTYKVGRGLWAIPVNGSAPKAIAEKAKTKKVEPVVEPVTITDKVTAPTSIVEMTKGTTSTITNVPSKDPLFVPFGSFSDVNSIFKSNMFYPIYVTGLSGNGKTFMIEQAAAK
ncbi:MAG: hypothetical protein QGH83_08615, partial [Candidatus Pacebacteria bacterium]|nr:hypothetical protein [Candidatus Paceibacterota bacterium]